MFSFFISSKLPFRFVLEAKTRKRYRIKYATHFSKHWHKRLLKKKHVELNFSSSFFWYFHFFRVASFFAQRRTFYAYNCELMHARYSTNESRRNVLECERNETRRENEQIQTKTITYLKLKWYDDVVLKLCNRNVEEDKWNENKWVAYCIYSNWKEKLRIVSLFSIQEKQKQRRDLDRYIKISISMISFVATSMKWRN